MAATVVLIHGGWSGSWTWEDVSEGLDERGIANRAVDLPSCSATTPDVDFRDDAKHVRDVIDEIGGPVILAGNSYGGVVMTEAAVDNPSVKHLVYLAAFIPVATESVMNQLMSATDPGFGAGMKMRDDSLTELPLELALERAYQQASPEAVKTIEAHAGRPMSFGSDPNLAVSGAAWQTTPSTYVVCTEDLAIRPEAQREWAKERATHFVEWPSDHCPQHSHPDDVAELLAKIAADAA